MSKLSSGKEKNHEGTCRFLRGYVYFFFLSRRPESTYLDITEDRFVRGI